MGERPRPRLTRHRVRGDRAHHDHRDEHRGVAREPRHEHQHAAQTFKSADDEMRPRRKSPSREGARPGWIAELSKSNRYERSGQQNLQEPRGDRSESLSDGHRFLRASLWAGGPRRGTELAQGGFLMARAGTNGARKRRDRNGVASNNRSELLWRVMTIAHARNEFARAARGQSQLRMREHSRRTNGSMHCRIETLLCTQRLKVSV